MSGVVVYVDPEKGIKGFLPMKKITVVWIFLVLVFPLSAENISSVILKKAENLVGVPYRYGGTTPAGFDCSGFITYLYKKYVPHLPRISRDMAQYGKKIIRTRLQPGDLIFFATGASPDIITHVALYIGDNTIVHAVSGGPQTGVIITSLNTRYWKRRYKGAVRILPYVNSVRQTEKSSGNGSGTELKKTSEKSLSGTSTRTGKGVSSKNSPWNSFDGIIEGDFNLWLKKDNKAFEEWKKHN